MQEFNRRMTRYTILCYNADTTEEIMESRRGSPLIPHLRGTMYWLARNQPAPETWRGQ